MRKIDKQGQSPKCLTDWIPRKEKSGKATYSEFKKSRGSKELRQELAQEQSELCAYTGAKLYDGNALTEHIYPRSWTKQALGKAYGRRADKDLDYYNLIAALDYNVSESEKFGAHAKANDYDAQLFVSPLVASCEQAFTYNEFGGITGNSYEANYTMMLLRLWHPTLANERLGAIQAYFPNPDDEEFPFPTFERIKEISETIMQPDADGKLKPYCFVIKAVADSYLKP